MTQELIYTSAPRGLKPGSRGFCTVMSTFGMAANLAQRLEALSGYRHVYRPQDANARLNPVAFSHLLLTVGGRGFHVISRIADAGLDYTQRTNKIAHHIVLDMAERVPGGPAWLLRQPGFLETKFEGDPRVIQTGRKPPAGDDSPAQCRRWAQVAGDAGWGGALAEALAKGRKAFIVFAPGMEMLPLVAESLALMPAAKRWGVTFSTYFTGLPPGLDCQLACVLKGSPEHARIRRLPNAFVVDLTGAPGRAPSGVFVDAARSGDVSALTATPRPDRRKPTSQPRAKSKDAAGPADVALATALQGETEASPDSLGLASSVPPPRNPPLRSSARLLRPFKKKKAAKWPYVLLASLAVLIVAGSGTAMFYASRQGAGEETAKSGDGQGQEQVATQATEEPDNPNATVEDPKEESPEDAGADQPEDDQNPEGTTPEETPPAGSESESNPETQPSDEPDPQPEATDGNDSGQSPASGEEGTGEPESTPQDDPPKPEPEVKSEPWRKPVDILSAKDGKWVTIAGKDVVGNPDGLTLKLIGLDRAFDEDLNSSLQLEEKDGEWPVPIDNIPCASFRIDNGTGRLEFRWTNRALGGRLCNCRLDVLGKNGGHVFASVPLREPFQSDKVSLSSLLKTGTLREGEGFKGPGKEGVPKQFEVAHSPECKYLLWEFCPAAMNGLRTSDSSSCDVVFHRSEDGWLIRARFDNKHVIEATKEIRFMLSNEQKQQLRITGAATVAISAPSLATPLDRQEPEYGDYDKTEGAVMRLLNTVNDKIEPMSKRIKALEDRIKSMRKGAAKETLKSNKRRCEEDRRPYLDYASTLSALFRELEALRGIMVGYRIYFVLGDGDRILLVDGTYDPPRPSVQEDWTRDQGAAFGD